MLQLRGDDDVPRPDHAVEPAVPHRIRHQVQRLGGVLGEHQLVVIGTDERRDGGARTLVGIGGLFGQLMRPAVYGGVARGQKFTLGVEYLHGPLRGGTGVQIHQRLTVSHGAREDGEVAANRGDIERCRHRRSCGCSHTHAPVVAACV